MAENDWETGKPLVIPHVEIGKGLDSSGDRVRLNISTVIPCLELLVPTFSQEFSDYSVYGVVGDTTRTRMGFLSADIVESSLPKTYERLNLDSQREKNLEGDIGINGFGGGLID